MQTQIQSNGLITTGPGSCAGYILNCQEHGAFDPSGKVSVNGQELAQAQIDKHNSILAQAEWSAMLKAGRGLLYLSKPNPETTAAKLGHYKISTWGGGPEVYTYHERKSWHNMSGRDGRTDVWFMLDGSRWHGVNIGDNDIVRVKRCKS